MIKYDLAFGVCKYVSKHLIYEILNDVYERRIGLIWVNSFGHSYTKFLQW